MSALAINGGSPVRTLPFPPYNTIGDEEKRAVAEVLDSAVLSGFLGAWTDDFYGGPRVRKFEGEWASYFDVEHAIGVNSATSGLYAAVGAAGVGPGDEVIVSPYTMSASATAALIWGGVPVFADIDPETFCLSASSIASRITPLTKAIIVVDIFGHPADMPAIMAIAREHGIAVIEDAAQAPGARLGDQFAGTLGDIGVFSLNYHKTIHTGEGGVVVTDDARLAERVQLIRNHAEAVVEGMEVEDLTNMVGFNFRMTEIEAAIGSEQLKKLEGLLLAREDAAEYLTAKIAGLPGLRAPVVRPAVRHGWYVYAMRYDRDETGIPRARFAEAIAAEGVPIHEGYVKPLYLQPMFQQRVAVGREGFPFTYAGYRGSVDYQPGICPNTERMYGQELLYTTVCRAGVGQSDLDDVGVAFHKVSEHIAELR